MVIDRVLACMPPCMLCVGGGGGGGGAIGLTGHAFCLLRLRLLLLRGARVCVCVLCESRMCRRAAAASFLRHTCTACS